MSEKTIQNYINRIAELEKKVTDSKEEIGKQINIQALMLNPREYIKDLAMDFYESHEKLFREAVELGEKKADKMIKQYVKSD